MPFTIYRFTACKWYNLFCIGCRCRILMLIRSSVSQWIASASFAFLSVLSMVIRCHVVQWPVQWPMTVLSLCLHACDVWWSCFPHLHIDIYMTLARRLCFSTGPSFCNICLNESSFVPLNVSCYIFLNSNDNICIELIPTQLIPLRTSYRLLNTFSVVV